MEMQIQDPVTKEEEMFIEHTGYLFDWSQCEGLLGPDRKWIEKKDLTLTKALELIEDKDFTPLPF